MELTSDDLAKAAQLRRMKLVAVGLLLAAAVVYTIALAAGGDGAWGYVEAGAEAAMVGALADWFAVTALFRHPLGLPIPHTAIVPRRKDQIGRSLGDFVEGNFLTTEVIDERLRDAELARRAGEWLSEPANAERVAAVAADGLRAALEVLDDDEVQAGIERIVTQRLDDVNVAHLAGTGLDITIEDGHFQRAIDATIDALDAFMGDSRTTFQRKLYDESPWWVPESVDDRVLDKIYDVVGRFLTEVRGDADHEIRRQLQQRATTFAERLRNDPQLAAKGEQLKGEVLEHHQVRAWLDSLWSEAKAALIEMADDPTSELRVRMARSYQRFGERLATEPEVQAKLEHWIVRGANYLIDNYRSEVSALISSTIDRWDGKSTARKMELQVGRDLQFIRINGTLVGGLAGLVIHALSSFF